MPGIRTTPTVRILLIVNCVAFLVHLIGDTFLGMHLLDAFALTPYQVVHSLAIWQFFTYMFMHADIFHILFNMLILWMIGSELEGLWGRKFFTLYYFICGISGGLFYFIIQFFTRNPTAGMISMVGSSGAVYGLLVAYGIIYAERTLLFMMIFPMKAKHFVLLLAAVEFISTVFYTRSGIANAAHLGGMVVGFSFLFLTAWWRVVQKKKRTGHRSKLNRKHLKLVVNNKNDLGGFDDDNDDGSQKPTFH